MTDYDIARQLSNLQADCYERFGIESAPRDSETYDEYVSWIVDQIRKSNIIDFIDKRDIDYLEDWNCHMAARAVERIINE